MSLADVRPLRDGILVRVSDFQSPSSLIMTTPPSQMNCAHDAWGTKYKVRWGEVVRTGPGGLDKKHRLIPITVNPGDIVSFAGMTKAEDGEHVLITEKDVLAVETHGRHAN